MEAGVTIVACGGTDRKKVSEDRKCARGEWRQVMAGAAESPGWMSEDSEGEVGE